jgi:SAM-dependent methyltransferase
MAGRRREDSRMIPTEQNDRGDAHLIPPTEMLHDGTSSSEEFILFGDNFRDYILRPRAHLPPAAAILDVGCGNGSVARSLTHFLSAEGRYDGVDVNGRTVAWLQDRYRKYPNFRFTHADVWNKVYNPGGGTQGASYRFPFADGAFDVVLLKSVFTHMLPADVETYMAEIGRVLKKGGRAVITYFLLNTESRRFIDRGLDVHGLKHDYAGDPLCRVSDPSRPELVVAHDEQRVRDGYARIGCTLLEMVFGNWCGRASLLGHQDLIIAIKN